MEKATGVRKAKQCRTKEVADGRAGKRAGKAGGVSLEDEDDDEARSPNRCFCLSLSCFCTFLIFADVSGARQASLASSDDAAAWDFGTG